LTTELFGRITTSRRVGCVAVAVADCVARGAVGEQVRTAVVPGLTRAPEPISMQFPVPVMLQTEVPPRKWSSTCGLGLTVKEPRL
jgi:hypothetical protein